jgi:hypothetical protein
MRCRQAAARPSSCTWSVLDPAANEEGGAQEVADRRAAARVRRRSAFGTVEEDVSHACGGVVHAGHVRPVLHWHAARRLQKGGGRRRHKEGARELVSRRVFAINGIPRENAGGGEGARHVAQHLAEVVRARVQLPVRAGKRHYPGLQLSHEDQRLCHTPLYRG